jgi:hypothetical protein
MRTTEVIAKIKAEFQRLGYKWFEGEDFDLNLFGIRHPDMGNVFNDLLCCAYKMNGEWKLHLWRGTTDPGRYYLQNPMNSNGTAILVPGQYSGMWELGKHRGKYKALTQRGECVVWRDVDKDTLLDFSLAKKQPGKFGINWHKAGKSSQQVDKWSAGCQVHGDEASFDKSIWLAEQQQKYHPTWKTYTYTLLTLMEEPGCQKSEALSFLFDLAPGWETSA